jgi:hypothetical protein
MKQLIEKFSALPSGYGHYKISIEIEGVTYSATTTNTRDIDGLKDEEEYVVNHAKKTLIDHVCYKNDLGLVEMVLTEYAGPIYWLHPRPNKDELITPTGTIYEK